VEEFSESALWKVAEEIPPEWYGGDPGVIERLDGVVVAAEVEGERVDWAVSGVKSGAVPTMGNGEEYCDSERL
jgi:hypothetical protein